MDKIVLIVAAGTGTRMQNNVPKQFMLLKGQPLLMRTIQVFHKFDPFMKLRVILPGEYLDVWKGLCKEHDFQISHEIWTGGETRFESVRNGIKDIGDGVYVAVHDGVRPLVSQDTIERCFRAAASFGNAVPCVEIPESIRKIGENGNHRVDRNLYKLIQTPQVFNSSILKRAYQQKFCEHFTDDASVVENLNLEIHLVQGNIENIKITHRHDLLYAETMIMQKNF